MLTSEYVVKIPAGAEEELWGTVIWPGRKIPAFLMVHGWGGDQSAYLASARQVASMGCLCMTLDLRGHARTEPLRGTITPEDNLQDVAAAYDLLLKHPAVDRNCIGVIGSSYGAFLAVRLAQMRPLKWLGLRVPALYQDAHLALAKSKIDRHALNQFRGHFLAVEDNSTLQIASQFEGDVLIVESETDDYVPNALIKSYRAAFRNSRSLTYRLMAGADHSLSDPKQQSDYCALLVKWVREIVLGEANRESAPQRELEPAQAGARPEK